MLYKGVLIGLAAAALGGVSAVLAHVARRWLARLRTGDAAYMIVASLAAFAIHILGLAPFFYFAPFHRPLLQIMVLAWMGGIGLTRWWLREL